jgi:hypothetical protein
MSRYRLSLLRLCPLSPWVGQQCPQIMALLLPIGSRKGRIIGFGSTAVGSPVWGANRNPIKNREEGGTLALGGCLSSKILNNQLIVGGSGMEDVRVEAHGGGST